MRNFLESVFAQALGGLVVVLLTNTAIVRLVPALLPWAPYVLAATMLIFVVGYGIFLQAGVNRKIRSLERLGWIATHERAESTIWPNIQRAKDSYIWLGTSSNWVAGNPKVIELMEKKPGTSFVFVTLDPDCFWSISAQARWQLKEEPTAAHLGKKTDELRKRIQHSGDALKSLITKGSDLVWEQYSRVPTFRVEVIDKQIVMVSFYEKTKSGPECVQLELAANSLIGQWFIDFVDKSRMDARISRVLKAALEVFRASTVPALSLEEFSDALEKAVGELDRPTAKRLAMELHGANSATRH